MVNVWYIRTAGSIILIHLTPHLLPISGTEVPSLYEQDAINGYVLELALEQEVTDLLSNT